MAAAAAPASSDMEEDEGPLPKTFANVQEFTSAVQMLALKQNKKVSTDSSKSGKRGRTFVCVHYVAAKKAHNTAVAEAAKKKYADDEEQQKEFKKLNPFTAPADSVCQFKATATKGRKTTEWVLSDTSNLTHSTFCPVSGGRVKASLLTSSASFAASVSAAGGKATKKVLAAEAAKAGLGGVAADPELLWRAQRALRKQANAAWDAQWAELPRYLEKLRERGAKVALDYDDESTFLRAFVAFTSVYDALKIAGRPVCSTDFGHMKHDFFQGLNATGVFQFGDGVAVPLWAAIFADADESAFHWEWCAKQIKAAGMSDIYDKIAHFRDRHVGAERFESILDIEFGLFCTVHIIRNVRSTKTCEKDFHDNMIWRVQASASEEEYAANLAKFKGRFPGVFEYLHNIRPEKWVHYGMVKRGARTYGWRSNNLGEIGQGSLLGNMRAMHPLDFFSNLQMKAYGKLGNIVKMHKMWAGQQAGKPIGGFVPHAIRTFNERVEAAQHCTVVGFVGGKARVSYVDPLTHQSDPERIVDLAKKECTCLDFQAYEYPCKCAIAASLKQGIAANIYIPQTAAKSYRLFHDELAVIMEGVAVVAAPSTVDLASLDDDAVEGFTLKGPLKRTKESHGNNKRKRKRRGRAASTGRTATRSYAAASSSKAARMAARQQCAKCTAAGRLNLEPHKSTICPYDEHVPKPTEHDFIFVSDDSDDT